MAARRKSTLLAQGKERRLDGTGWPWRVRLYGPAPGESGYQVIFKAPAGEGEPWKRVLRRASTEEEARKIFAQAEAALDTETEAPAPADVRASRTIRMLGEEYLKDSRERGKQPRTMEQRESRLRAHINPTIGDVPVAKWRVEHSRKVMEKGAKTLFSARGREDLRGQLAAMRKLAWRLGWLDRSIDPLDGLEIGNGLVHLATVRLGARRSAWNAADARGEVERLLAATGAVVDGAVRRELAEDLTARVVAASRPLLGRTDVPEHVRNLTSTDVLAVEHEIVDRIARRATAKTLTVIEGAAGAGNNTRLAATRKAIEARGHKMLVVTPTRKAAQVAMAEVGRAHSVAWLLFQHGFRWDADGRWTRVEALPSRGALLSPGDLMVVDEAGMLDQDTARALLDLADQTGVNVMLVGDRHQLPAVGRGGVLDLTVRYAPDRVMRLDTVRRFADPSYAELSLRMRRGEKPGEVFDELMRRGEIVIHASDVERQQKLAVRTIRGDLVVADTREQVTKINGLTHQVRTSIGEVTDAIVTASGERIGVGDLIATRRNDHDTDVANRETWTVIAAEGGALTVQGEAGKRVLPPEYVCAHVELAYATTAYGAQGSTVPVSHVIVGEHTGASSAYVGMTRGRESNVAHLVAETVEDARNQWIAVFGRDRADLGPTHARGAAAEAIDRYGPNAPKRPAARRVARRNEDDLAYRPPASSPSSGPSLGI